MEKKKKIDTFTSLSMLSGLAGGLPNLGGKKCPECGKQMKEFGDHYTCMKCWTRVDK